MKSLTLPSFWKLYRKLPAPVRKAARKAYRQFVDDSTHPGLHFSAFSTIRATGRCALRKIIGRSAFAMRIPLRGCGSVITKTSTQISRDEPRLALRAAGNATVGILNPDLYRGQPHA